MTFSAAAAAAAADDDDDDDDEDKMQTAVRQTVLHSDCAESFTLNPLILRDLRSPSRPLNQLQFHCLHLRFRNT